MEMALDLISLAAIERKKSEIFVFSLLEKKVKKNDIGMHEYRALDKGLR